MYPDYHHQLASICEPAGSSDQRVAEAAAAFAPGGVVDPCCRSALGGKIAIHSPAGAGTSLDAELPLAA